MRRIRQNKMLGLVIGDRSIVAAEVSTGGASSADAAKPRVTRTGVFPYPQGITLAQPAELGTALAEFLKQAGFTARSAVLGVPARWVLSKLKEVPPATPALVAETLRLQAEGEFSPDIKDLLFDYAGQTSTSEARSVLLMAIPARHVEQLTAMGEAARLSAAAITPVSIAVAAVVGAASGSAAAEAQDGLAFSTVPGGMELVAYRGPDPRSLRHLGAAAAAPALVGELRRALAAVPGVSVNGPASARAEPTRAMPAGVASDRPGSAGATTRALGNGAATNGAAGNGSTAHDGNGSSLNALLLSGVSPRGGSGAASVNGRTLTLWGATGLDAAARRDAAAALGVSVEAGNPASLGVTGDDEAGDLEAFTPAIALALAGVADAPIPADFLHSRLAPPKQPRIGRRTLLVAGVCLAVVLGSIYAYVDLQRQQRELAEGKVAIEGDKPRIKTAEATIAKITYAQGWHGGDPRYLAALRDLTLAIPDDEKLYLTSFTLRDNMKGTIAGKSSSDVVALSRQLQATKRFADVNVDSINTREAARVGREVSFSISFTYKP